MWVTVRGRILAFYMLCAAALRLGTSETLRRARALAGDD
jgi:hypothetical protein